MTVLVLVLARARPAHRVPLGLMAAGVTLMSLSDSWFAYLTATNPYQTGDLIDLGWVGPSCSSLSQRCPAPAATAGAASRP
jgi:hypothetical protein